MAAEGRLYRRTESPSSRGGFNRCVRRQCSGNVTQRTRDARPYGKTGGRGVKSGGAAEKAGVRR